MPAPLTRRSFLAAGAAGGFALLVDPRVGRSRAAVPLATDVAFTQGVASGQPGSRAVTLWSHLDGLTAPARVGVEVARDPGFGRVLLATEAIADPAAGGTARIVVEGGRLRPGERYWYRFSSAAGSSPVGRFATARPADSREPVRIAFFSCQEYIAGFYHAHRDLAARDDIDLVVCLGDYVYEQAFAGTGSVSPPVRSDGTGEGGEAQTLDEYRAKYALYHTDPDLLAVRQRFPLVAIYDDHEVEDNYAGELPGGATRDRRVPFPERRANGYQAWREAQPGLAADGPIFGSRRFGLVELFTLDSRRYRDDQPCNPDDGALTFGCAPADYNAPRTLLGVDQKAWLTRGLTGSTAPWKIVANQVMIMSLDAPPGSPLNTDSWDGYGAERLEILQALAAAGTQGVSFITGDIHTFFAGDVHPTGRRLATDAGPASPAVATEFVGGSITSPGIVDRLASDETGRVLTALPIDLTLRALNPHILFSNQAYKGYGVVTATRENLAVDFRAVRDTRLPDSTVFTLASLATSRTAPEVRLTRLGIPPATTARAARHVDLRELRPRGLSLGAGDLA